MTFLKLLEFEKWLLDNQGTIGSWRVEPHKKVLTKCTLGCYYEPETYLWKVYLNDEKKHHVVYLETEDEDTAYNELRFMVTFTQRNLKVK